MLFFALPWCVACVIDDAYFVKWLIPVHVGAAVLCQLVCGYIYMQYLAQNHCFGLFGPLVASTTTDWCKDRSWRSCVER
jgi:hypothetical protein